MKTNLLRLSMAAVLASAAAFAQSSGPLQADVPFDFIVGSKKLPAGPYMVDQRTALGAVLIRSSSGNGGAFAMVQARSSAVTGKAGSLTFHRYGEAYFLSEVWPPGADGYQLATTPREREIAKQIAAPTATTIAARR
jgi:hypothetical protein